MEAGQSFCAIGESRTREIGDRWEELCITGALEGPGLRLQEKDLRLRKQESYATAAAESVDDRGENVTRRMFSDYPVPFG